MNIFTFPPIIILCPLYPRFIYLDNLELMFLEKCIFLSKSLLKWVSGLHQVSFHGSTYSSLRQGPQGAKWADLDAKGAH